ncbi:ribonuclease 3 [Hibiscus trionum]|uniref:Ribonuclease 3 n=1 Tax=Hibiscus trionum TaxID=183268 RepID=A0A9W7MN87_HIBTR|nr:ribonuclease 3 [Hibiscus trionum]
MKLNSCSVIIIHLFVLQCLSVVCLSQDFDFFYFVQQWPGAYCDTRRSCCYPTTGKPAEEFGIHGLWPNYNDGSYPSNCDPDSSFDESKISDLIPTMQKEWPTLACPSGDGFKFWDHEWTKHGTCSESELNERQYFEAAIALKGKANLLQALTDAGIKPNDELYKMKEIRDAIKVAIGYTPGIECNVDEFGTSQLYQVYLCVDTSGSDFIECPVLPRARCGSSIQFPKF